MQPSVRRPVCLIFALAGFGCAHGPGVSSDHLPLTRVVIYRNGVAYFERSGVVDEPRVEFQVKQDHVGDFLATLSVMEQGGSSVRSASFPIRLKEGTKAPPDGKTGAGVDASDLKTVTLEVDGRRHDLAGGTHAPRTSRRCRCTLRPSPQRLATVAELTSVGALSHSSGRASRAATRPPLAARFFVRGRCDTPHAVAPIQPNPRR